jgi:hypothetical protein
MPSLLGLPAPTMKHRVGRGQKLFRRRFGRGVAVGVGYCQRRMQADPINHHAMSRKMRGCGERAAKGYPPRRKRVRNECGKATQRAGGG